MENNTIDKIFNMQYYANSNISLIKALLFFYLIIALNFTRNLYSGQLIDYLSNNRFIQHLIGIILMLVIIVEIGNVRDPYTAIFYTILAYLWFVLSTKLDIYWNLAILGLLVFGFLYENLLVEKEIKSLTDESLEEKDKINIKEKNNKIKTYI